MFSHLTGNLDNLLSILDIGLIFFPNKRKVFNQLSSGDGVSLEEPQCQGMISFTDIPFEIGGSHREKYGNYGVVLDKNWAISKGACKVIYVGDRGNVFEAFKSMFTILAPKIKKTGDVELDSWLNELVRTKPEFSKSVGNNVYPHLLTLHQYMQTDEHVSEYEWRMIRPHKSSWSKGMNLSEVKQYYLKAAKSKLIPSLEVEPSIVKGIICPSSEKEILLSKLTSKWKNTEIWTH